MNVVIQGRRVALTKSHLIGEGGEAKVYRVQDQAVKIFHACPPLSSALTKRERARLNRQAARQLQEKAEKIEILRRDFSLPAEVICPTSLVVSNTGSFLGYTMPLCSGGLEAGGFLHPATRPAGWSLAQACTLLGDIHRVLSELHAHGLVVGDLNDGNILIAGGLPRLIDVDSFQVPRQGQRPLRCVVAHEKYLDPHLYGADFVGEHAPVVFSEASDWYAFSVFAFQLLTLVHPYGGVVRGIPTLLRRAEARHSVMRPDVKRPRAALPFDCLSDELLAAFACIFDGDERGPFDATLFACRWTRCSCGIEHAKVACPTCHSQARRAPTSPSVATAGSAQEVSVFEAKAGGSIVDASVFGGIRGVVETITQDGMHVFTDLEGKRIFESPSATSRVHSCGAQRWVTHEGRAAELSPTKGTPLEDKTFALDRAPNGQRAFATSSGHAFGAISGALWDLTQQCVVGQCSEHQTHLAGGGGKLVGVYRLDASVIVFCHRVGSSGLSDTVVGTPGGRLVAADVAFDPDPDGPMLLTLVWNIRGDLESQWLLIDVNANILATRKATLNEGESGATTTGRCVFQGTVVVAEDQGLTAYRSSAGSARKLEATRSFPSTANAVDPSVQLIPDGSGGIFVVRPQAITRLLLS